MSRPISIVHIITGLSVGGAEAMLIKLLSRTDQKTFQPRVVSLTDQGPIANKIRDLGVPVYSLSLNRRFPNPLGIIRLIHLLRKWRPHVVQTWMYHADLVGGLAARLANVPHITWNIRHSTLDTKGTKRRTIMIARVCAWLSRKIPELIVCCSEASRNIHSDLGYDESRMVVIPNGFDLNDYQPNHQGRNEFRRAHSIPLDAFVVGHVGRYDRQKDHFSLLKAFSMLDKSSKIYLILCGKDVTRENKELARNISTLELGTKVYAIGLQSEIWRIYPAFDVLVSSSFSEGFPNVVGEAMACGIPCVVTAVGDSAMIVGNTGIVVPPKNPSALAEGIKKILNESPNVRAALGTSARLRITERFDIANIVSKYEDLYMQLADFEGRSKE